MAAKKKWTSNIDPATIPDEVVFFEASRRRSLMRKTFGARPKVLRPCPKCGEEFGARELREHLTECKPVWIIGRRIGSAPFRRIWRGTNKPEAVKQFHALEAKLTSGGLRLIRPDGRTELIVNK
jgi:hypothetical protein